MGIYLNPGNISFWQSIRSEIYVDKTELITQTNKYLNARERFICVSRPRRFGKSMTLEMTQALEGYVGEILLIGVNYDENNKDKPHTCMIEKSFIR